MNGFTSGTQALQGRTVNHDPEPWTYFDGSRIVHGVAGPNRNVFAPRPKFDVLDNPILAELRLCTGAVPENAHRYLELLDCDVYDWRVVPAEQREHARRVLLKLEAQKCNSI